MNILTLIINNLRLYIFITGSKVSLQEMTKQYHLKDVSLNYETNLTTVKNMKKETTKICMKNAPDPRLGPFSPTRHHLHDRPFS